MGYVDNKEKSNKGDAEDTGYNGTVDKILNKKLPKCLTKDSNCNLNNYFLTKKSSTSSESGKRVIRRRLSAYQMKAAIQYNSEKTSSNNNSNNNVPKHELGNGRAKSHNDRSSGVTVTDKQSAYVLQAKVQHLLFEMKKIRQTDRDLLRQFYTINNTIDELKWMVEEKEASLARDLLEEQKEELEDSDDPYEKDMLALEEEIDLGVEQDNDDVDSAKDDSLEFDDKMSASAMEGNTDTMDSGLTKSISSLSLTNSSPTMSYQMSAASSRSHSPTDSNISSSLTHMSSCTKSSTDCVWEKRSQMLQETDVPQQCPPLYETSNPGVVSYSNATYDEQIPSYISHAHSVDYVSRKRQYLSHNDISTRPEYRPQNDKLYHSLQINSGRNISKTATPSQMNGRNSYLSRRCSDISNAKVSASSRLLKHPNASTNQIHRSTSFQENTPSLQPWKYRFVPIAEHDAEPKRSAVPYVDRRNDCRYNDPMSIYPRQSSQNFDINQTHYDTQFNRPKLIKNRKVSGVGSAGSLTSQSSSSDSSTSSLHSIRNKESRRTSNESRSSENFTPSVNYNGESAEIQDTIYKRPLTTVPSSIYKWVRSQNDDVMYL